MPVVDNGIDLMIDSGVKIQIKCGQKQPINRENSPYNCYKFNFHQSFSKSGKLKYGSTDVIKPHKLVGVDIVILWAIDMMSFILFPLIKLGVELISPLLLMRIKGRKLNGINGYHIAIIGVSSMERK